MIELVHFQIVSAALFTVGLYGVLARRSAVLVLMSIELMLNAVNINLVAAASHLNGKYTVWGQVIEGMEHVDKLKRGSPPRNPDKIIRMRVGADVKK